MQIEVRGFEITAFKLQRANRLLTIQTRSDLFQPPLTTLIHTKSTALVQGHSDILIRAKLYPMFSTYVGQ